MAARLISRTPAVVLLALLGLVVFDPDATTLVRAQGATTGTDAQRDAGKRLYDRYCSQCHGDKGDGEGYASPHLSPRPRNFTSGKFKIRSTPSGAIPTHQDLINVIRRGMPYTSMPAWPNLSDQDVSNVAYYIKSFSPEFAAPENAAQPVDLPGPPSSSNESIELGKKLYVDSGCVKCHGDLGRGDGPSAPTLKDDWGYPIRPADLTQTWTFRGGSSREDIFRTMTTGLNGTPMPSFMDALTVEQRWAITDYIVSLSGADGPNYTNLVIAKHVPEPIDLAKGAASFASARIARFPIVGQIMEPARSFHPPATNVMVQAIYDADSIALLVRWHDMSAEKGGKNAPTLPVPVEEEETPAIDASAPSGPPSGDPFAEDAAPAPGQAKDPFADETAAAAPASEFSDAVAVQTPAEPVTGARKPYFIFGDPQNAIDLWFFDLAQQSPLRFAGKGSGDLTSKEPGDLSGVAGYDRGEWSVIFKRPLRPEAGAPFVAGEFMPIAFSVWDGASRERGNRRGLTSWYSLYLEPQDVPSAVGPMVRTALIILAIELAVVGWVRWRFGSRARGAAGGNPTQAAATRA